MKANRCARPNFEAAAEALVVVDSKAKNND